MLARRGEHDVLDACANASPPARRCRRRPSTPGRTRPGIKIIDGIGATEMLHIFIAAPRGRDPPRRDRQAGAGLRGEVVDDDGRDLPPGTVGRLAVRGPTGCRYLADARQRKYVQDGWNVTGDTYLHG